MSNRTTQPRISRTDAEQARVAAQKVVETHRRIAAWLRPGMTLAEIDVFVATTLDALDCKSCFLHYRNPPHPPFPSHSCLSVNDCVVHGTAGSLERRLRGGDVLKVDIGVSHKGWIGDAAWTYAFAPVAKDVTALMECGKESLRRGVRELRPGNTFLAWAQTVQKYVEGECGFHLVRGLGGHGYGRKLHEPPYVSNVVPAFSGEWTDASTPCEPDTLVAVEPMIAIGTGKTSQRGREWPVYMADGSMSVHYEHDVLITGDGPRVLTEGLDELKDVIE